ncbi:hypothetical protein BD410DRAFT_783696 [Rickenella mellea]|uniref:DUF6533 domain-containing protein n=1 Tax=Rickenella mellea TaxID=50990 RepID=A0A4Y7QIF3_9AGAM|nr:hypothetical protein BD410DRAFT_783696 [Rickenella mellea]
MAATTSLELAQVLSEGFLSTKYLSVASLFLLIYDHLTCLDQEIEYFWVAKWSLTRILYFLNRYIPPGVFICTYAIRTTATFEVVGLALVEAILVIRVFYLWSHSSSVRLILLICFTAAIATSVTYSGVAVHHLKAFRLPFPFEQGCLYRGAAMDEYWPIFLPIIVPFLFVLTLVRCINPLRLGQNKSFATRLVRDGGFFFLMAALTTGYNVVGSAELGKKLISLPALESSFILAMHSICASHLMLSIHSLAADIGADPTHLLSNIEIARVSWKNGSRPGELVVEMRADEHSNLDLTPIPSPNSTTTFGSDDGIIGKVRTSRVGDLTVDIECAQIDMRGVTVTVTSVD